MEVTSARATLVDFAGDRAEAALVTIPVSEVEDALREDGAPELVLDVTRFAGEGDSRTEDSGQISVRWTKEELESILKTAQGGTVTLAFDGNALLQAFEADVEGHGLREVAATLGVAIVVGGSAFAGAASAQVAQGTSLGGSTAIEQVRSDAGAPPGAAIEAARSADAAASASLASSGIEALRADSAETIAASAPAGASDIEATRSAAGNETIAASAPTPGVSDIEATRLAAGNETIAASAPTPGVSDIEATRLAAGNETIAASAPTPGVSDIEAVRSAEAALTAGGPQAASAVEAARSAEIAAGVSGTEAAGSIEATRAAAAEAARAGADTGGISVSMPSAATVGWLAGGIALLISGAAFVAASQRQRMRPA